MVKKQKKPKINMYRNISISFIIFTVMLLATVFFLFYNHAKIVVMAGEQDINLNFNVEVKASSTPQELAEKDVVTGKMTSWEKSGTGEFAVLSTKSGSGEFVGKVKIVNNSTRNQPLAKTTQLQADNGVIVRTSEAVMVPAGGSVTVSVYPKDPATFIDVEPGNLVIIKLASALQPEIYGTVSTTLSSTPSDVKALAESDITKAKTELSASLADEVKKENNISAGDGVSTDVIEAKTDQKVGAEVDKFNLDLKVKVSALQLDKDQLLVLLGRKVSQLNLEGFDIAPVTLDGMKYSIVDQNFGGSVVIKVDYVLKTKIKVINSKFDKSNIVGKPLEEARQYLQQIDSVKGVDIFNSPYWKKNLPKQPRKIELIVQ